MNGFNICTIANEICSWNLKMKFIHEGEMKCSCLFDGIYSYIFEKNQVKIKLIWRKTKIINYSLL